MDALVPLLESAGSPRNLSRALEQLGSLLTETGRIQEAEQALDQSRAIAVGLHDKVGVAIALASLAILYMETGRVAESERATLSHEGARQLLAASGLLPRTVEVPVCYGGDFGPDLTRVATQAKLSLEEVVKRHAKAEYRVHLIGFAPGFPYLGGLPKELVTPRHTKPRMEVPAGSVGIGGEQTGIYPQVTPGGWNLIGRTPLRLFRPEDDPPVLLQAGDIVKFRPVTPEEFGKLQEARS